MGKSYEEESQFCRCETVCGGALGRGATLLLEPPNSGELGLSLREFRVLAGMAAYQNCTGGLAGVPVGGYLHRLFVLPGGSLQPSQTAV